MMKHCIWPLLLFFSPGLRAQERTFDEANMEALIAHNKTNFADHQDCRDNQLASQATVSLWKKTTNTCVALYDSIDKRLNTIFILAADVVTLYNISQEFGTMLILQQESLAIAVKYPITIPALYNGEATIYNSAIQLFAYVGLMASSWGDISKMKVSARETIYREINLQVELLRNECYALYIKLQNINFSQIFKNTLPAQFYNQDKQLVSNIMQAYKF